jgi:hypothetical protein
LTANEGVGYTINNTFKNTVNRSESWPKYDHTCWAIAYKSIKSEHAALVCSHMRYIYAFFALRMIAPGPRLADWHESMQQYTVNPVAQRGRI